MPILFLFLLQESAAPVTLEKILIFLGGSGFLGGFLLVLKFIAERYDKLKEAKKNEKETEISETAELKDIEFKSSDQAKLWLEKILSIRDDEIKNLKKEIYFRGLDIDALETCISNAERKTRVIRREFEIFDIYFYRGDSTDTLKLQINVVRAALDELENSLSYEKGAKPGDKKSGK